MRLKTIAMATVVAGTLDIAAAMVLTLIAGKSITGMLQGVASGSLGEWPLSQGALGAASGLAVHFVLMAAMAAIFVVAAARIPALLRHPLMTGAAYGLAIYLVMYWVVLPLRWPATGGAAGLRAVWVPVAIHIVLVGIPIALVTAADGLDQDGARRPFGGA